ESARPDVFGAWADQFVVGVLFEDVACPTTDARDGEDRRVEVERDAHHVVGRGGIEINVGVHALLAVHDLFDAARNLVPFRFAPTFAHLAREATQVCGTRVFSFIDRVPDA